MANRLEPVNLADFSGGLNLRANQFQLSENESPEMENMVIDPLGGMYTRKGWSRVNGADIVDPDLETWDPRRAFLHQLSDGTDNIYIANKDEAATGVIMKSDNGGAWSQLGTIVCDATPHLADFAVYGDTLFIACGRDRQTARRIGTAAATLMTAAGSGSWNDDYDNPAHGVFPKCELVETHGGYVFAANMDEDGVDLPNRLRWSHPASADDWAQADFLDISIGGSEITALQSYEDHLLIFKHDSVWALYGYDTESWQLVQKSSTSGALSPQGVTRSEQAVFYHSASDRGAIYAYSGERPVEISTPIRDALQELLLPELIWVGWVGRRLWVTLPWAYGGPTLDNAAVLVFDPSIGQGAWVYFSCTEGSLGPIVAGSNTDSQLRPLGVMRDTETPSVVRIDALDKASDEIWQVATLGYYSPTEGDMPGFIVTDADEEITLSGVEADSPFPTSYRTPWLSAGWPTRKKSWRRPEIVTRYTGIEHDVRVRSFRDYEESNARRSHTMTVPSGGGDAVYGEFDWGDGTLYGTGRTGGTVRRVSSLGLAKAVQVALDGVTPGAEWGVDAIVLKIVMRRFR